VRGVVAGDCAALGQIRGANIFGKNSSS
jgi:hypothetical protein